MTIDVKKGHRINIQKENGEALTKFFLAGGWDKKEGIGDEFDLDLAIIPLNENNKLTSEDDICFFNNQVTLNGALNLDGDNRTGEGDGDDEVISINTDKIPENVTKLVGVIGIYEAKEKNQNFGMSKNASVRVLDKENDKETEHFKYDLTEDYSSNHAVAVCEIYKKDGLWKFHARGEGISDVSNIIEVYKKLGY